MFPFQYLKAGTVAEATKILAAEPNAKVLAGGMSLLPTMKLRLASPDVLVDMRGIEALSGIEISPRSVTVRAMTSHDRVATSPELQRCLPALSSLAAGIGDVQVRYRGTIGGSIANADPAADYPAAVLALGATVVTDRRSVPADDFFCGLFETALAADEVITAVEFPVPDSAVYLKFASLASRFALVGLFMARFGENVRVAVTGASSHVFRVREAEEALTRRLSPGELDHLEVSSTNLSSDIHASAEYRAHLVKVLAQRAAGTLA